MLGNASKDTVLVQHFFWEDTLNTYTVRKISNGVGVERIFPIHTPRVEKIEVVRYGKVRRAKLYYLRALQGKAARIKEIRR